MEDIIIRKKDLENFGRKLIKKVYKFLHDEYILSFEEMKVEKDKIEKYLLEFYYKGIPNFFNYLINIKNQKEIEDKIKDKNSLKEIEDKIKDKNSLKEIEDKIEDESLDIDLIYEVLNRIDLEFEIDEDLFCEKKAFIYIYLVLTNYYSYLKD